MLGIVTTWIPVLHRPATIEGARWGSSGGSCRGPVQENRRRSREFSILPRTHRAYYDNETDLFHFVL
jgi:hypothetical protein